ncbi:MAG TPA: ABC transporter permease [Candidatus Limnocylindrales bacterium]|nr:ABC transporter permease [Candidatus Limnocylindrales bacterium]
MQEQVPAAAKPPTAANRLSDVAARYQGLIVYLGFVLIVVFFSIVLRDKGFLTPDNLLNILRQTTFVSIMAIGMTFALSAGEIDLSIGSTVALSALVTAVFLRDFGIVLAIPVGLVVGLVIGLINGVITTKLRIPSFLVTLGMLGIISGLARQLTNLQSVPVTDDLYTYVFGSGSMGPVPTLIIWTALILFVGHIVYRRTTFGRQVLATGGNRTAARYSGIATDRIRIAVLVISSVTAAFAGMLFAGRLHGARYTLGEEELLTVIAAVVIGGTSLFGGRGSVIGAVIGSLIMGVLTNGLILMGLTVSEQMIARGAIIILAVALSLREAKDS